MDEIYQFILSSLAIFAFGLGMTLLAIFTPKKRRYITKYGIEVEGEITDYRAFYNPNDQDGIMHDDTSYYISCKYITKHGEEITKEFRDVSYRRKYTIKHPIGSKIKIIYLPEAEFESTIKGCDIHLEFYLCLIIGIGLFIFSAFWLYYGITTVYF